MLRISIISWVTISLACFAIIAAAFVEWENMRRATLIILGITSVIFLTISIVWSIENKNNAPKDSEQVVITKRKDALLRSSLLVWQIISTVCVAIALAPEIEWINLRQPAITIWVIATVFFLLLLTVWMIVKNKKNPSKKAA